MPLTKVAIPHAIKAFNSHTQQLKAAAGTTSATPPAELSPAAKKIRSVTLQGKMVLVSIIVHLARVRAGLPAARLPIKPLDLHRQHRPRAETCRRPPSTPPTLTAITLDRAVPTCRRVGLPRPALNLESLGLVVIGSASASGGRDEAEAPCRRADPASSCLSGKRRSRPDLGST